MRKNAIAISLTILLVVLGGMTAYFFISNSSDMVGGSASSIDGQSTITGLEGLTYIEDPKDFDGTKPIIKKMKERFSIVGTRYRGQGDGPPEAFELLVSWYGELEFTVNDAQWFLNFEESGIDKSEFASFNTRIADRPFVIVDVTINFKGENDSLFGTDIFQLSAKEDYELNNFYNSEHDDLHSYLEYFSLHGKEDDYYVFNLSVNHPLNFKLGFFVPEDTNKDELFLNLGGTNNDNLIGVKLDFSE